MSGLYACQLQGLGCLLAFLQDRSMRIKEAGSEGGVLSMQAGAADANHDTTYHQPTIISSAEQAMQQHTAHIFERQ
jgi:hypothetical protein